MRILILGSQWILLTAAVVLLGARPGYGGTITVTSPNGGETLYKGTDYNITWSSSGTTGNVKVEVYKGGVFFQQLAANDPNDGSCPFNPPPGWPSGSDYQVAVTTVDESVADFSDGNFTIISPSISVTYPNGGDTLYKGTGYTITWNSSGVNGNVKIEIYKGGALYQQIAADDPNDGSYPFNPPAGWPSGSDYKVAVAAVNGTASDFSDGNFTIATPAISVTYPNGGESLYKGGSYNITWSSSGVSGNVKVEVYKGGVFYQQLAANDPNDGSYPFNPPTGWPSGSDYKVAVATVDGSVADLSDGNFTITDPILTVTYPNGGETLYKGTDYNITWTSLGVSGNVKVEVYKGGVFYQQLAADDPNDGSYPFNPPAGWPSGADYKVAVAAVNGSAADFSDANLTITTQIQPPNDIVTSLPLAVLPTRTNSATMFSLPSSIEYGTEPPFEDEKNGAASFKISNSGGDTVTLDDWGILVTGGAATDFRILQGSSLTLDPGEESPLFDKRFYVQDDQLVGGSTTQFTAQIQVLQGSWIDVTGTGSSATFSVAPRPPLANAMLVKQPRAASSSDPDDAKIYYYQFNKKWHGSQQALDALFPDWSTEYYVYPTGVVSVLGDPTTPTSDSTLPMIASRNLVYKDGVDVYIIEPEPGLTIPLRSRLFENEGAFFSYGYTSSDLVTDPIPLDVDQVAWMRTQYPVGSLIEGPETAPAFLLKWGAPGSGPGQFNKPMGIAVDGSGYVYVADNNNHRIQKFTADGSFVSSWGNYCFMETGSGCVDPDGGGPLTVGDGQFSNPRGIATDALGNVFVADYGNNRIQKFDSNGQFLGKWGAGGGNGWAGSGNGEFILPWCIAADSEGNVYIGEEGNDRVQKLTGNGTYITKWGSGGTGPGQFTNPQGIAVDASGVYVSDNGNRRVQKFTNLGAFLLSWGTICNVSSGFGCLGEGDGQFYNLRGLAIGPNNDVYVADTGNHRIQTFHSDSTFAGKWGTQGAGDGEFDWPSDVAVGNDGSIYVADQQNHRIQKFGEGSVLTVLYPGDGDILYKGTEYTVMWTSTGAVGNVKVEVYKGGSFFAQLAANEPNDGAYPFNPPLGWPSDSDYQIAVVEVDGDPADLSDGQFSIADAPRISVTYPNGGEILEKGIEYTITWTSTGSVGNVKVEVYKGGSFYAQLAADDPNDGSYPFNPPAGWPSGSDYQIAVAEVDGDPADLSDANFSIQDAVPGDGFDYPVGPPDGTGYWICQDFLESVDEYCNHLGWDGTHLGEDWNRGSGSDDCGDVVYASARGTIVFNNTTPVPGWGNVLIVRHDLAGIGQIETLYGHLQTKLRTSGEVAQGEPIGKIGDGGGEDPCHLHFEIRLPSCPFWGSPGPGYSANSTGWVDPSDFIDAHPPTAGLTVQYPNGGQVLVKGTEYTITWNSSGVSGNVKVELYKGEEFFYQLAADEPNDGSYPFNPLSEWPDDVDYRVAVAAVDGSVFDFSDDEFTITEPMTISVGYPNGGETLKTGEGYTITWTSTGLVRDVKVEVYKGGLFYTQLAANDPNDGSYPFTPPAGWPNASDYQIAVAEVDGAPADLSDGYFTICDPLTIPSVSFDSRVYYESGVSATLTVDVASGCNIGSIRVEATLDPNVGSNEFLGSQVISLTPGLPTSVIFGWTVPTVQQQTIFGGRVDVYLDGTSSLVSSRYDQEWTVVSTVPEEVVTQTDTDIQTCDLGSECVTALLDVLPFIGTVSCILDFGNDHCAAEFLDSQGYWGQASIVHSIESISGATCAISTFSDLLALIGETVSEPVALALAVPAALRASIICTAALNASSKPSAGIMSVAEYTSVASDLADSLGTALEYLGRPYADQVLAEGPVYLIVAADSTNSQADSVGLVNVMVVDFLDHNTMLAYVGPEPYRLGGNPAANPHSATTIEIRAESDGVLSLVTLHTDSVGVVSKLLWNPFRVLSSTVCWLDLADNLNDFTLKVDYDGDGQVDASHPTVSVIGVPDYEPSITDPVARVLGSWPNPFRSSTRLSFQLSREVEWGEVQIFDIAGRQVWSKRTNRLAQGAQEVSWLGRDTQGAQLPSGVYLYRLVCPTGRSSAGRVVLVR